jgi:hypothetical protein
MLIPLYCLTEDYMLPGTRAKTLPKGAFVQIINRCYLPAHIKEDHPGAYRDTEYFSFGSTHFGIVPIPTNLLRPA